MKNVLTKVLSLLLLVALASCNNQSSSAETDAAASTAPADTTAQAAATETVQNLRAQFLSFKLGDANHFFFKDETGKEWDFGGSDVQDQVEFAQELPTAESNSQNQGWTSNKELQNKWFDLQYVVRQQPIYPDGPVGDVMVIVQAKMVQ